MKINKFSLPNESLKKMFFPWIEVINRRESASIINLSSRNQIYRVNQFLKNIGLYKDKIKDFRKIQFILLNVATIPFDDPEDIEIIMRKNFDQKKKRKVIILLDSDKLLMEKRELFDYLNLMLLKNNSLLYLYFFKKNITYSYITQKFSSFSSIYQNIIYIPLYNHEEISHFISYLEKYYRSTLPKKIVQKIKEYCGGRMWLVKEAIRYYLKTKDEKNLFDHEEINLKLQTIYDEFDLLEKQVLEKIIKKGSDFNKGEKEIIDYFLKIGLIKKERKNYFINIHILNNFIRKQLNQKNLITANEQGKLTVNGVLINGFFSRREEIFLRSLINSKKVTSREQAASILWGENYQEIYTDWALDQIVRRLRIKLEKLGLSKDLIKTVKNQGFKYE